MNIIRFEEGDSVLVIPDLDVFLRVHGPYLSNEYRVLEPDVFGHGRFYLEFITSNKSPLYDFFEKSDIAPIEILILEGIKENTEVYCYVSYEEHTNFFLEHGEKEYLRLLNKMKYSDLTKQIEQLKKKIDRLLQPDEELKDTFKRRLIVLSRIRRPYGDWLLKNGFEDDVVQISYKKRKHRKSVFEHSEDYSTVVMDGVEYNLSPNQRIIIKKLYLSYEKNKKKGLTDPGISIKYLRTNTEIMSAKMSDIFKGEKEIRKALIVFDKYRRIYRLNME